LAQLHIQTGASFLSLSYGHYIWQLLDRQYHQLSDFIGWQEQEQVKLLPVQVPLPVYCCTECNQQLKIFPSFCLRGTTLTLQALAFIGFVYETTELTWRDLPEMLCDPHNKIAHSTLYKAVHSTGKLMATEQEIQKLHLKYLPSDNPVQANPPLIWPCQRSTKIQHFRPTKIQHLTTFLSGNYFTIIGIFVLDA